MFRSYHMRGVHHRPSESEGPNADTGRDMMGIGGLPATSDWRNPILLSRPQKAGERPRLADVLSD